MFDHLTEIMLKNYFVAENTVGRFYEDKQALFSAYAKIFLLTEEEAASLFALTQREEVLGIQSERDYHQYLRMKQFMAINSRRFDLAPELDAVIDLKGTAFSVALALRLTHEAREARPVACENLTLAAESGLVLALNVLGVLQMEGIVFGKDAHGGLRKILNAVEWNSEEGLFAALRYDPAHKARYLGALRECLVRNGQAEALGRAERVYGPCPEEKHADYLLLEKAFRQGIVKREVYIKSYARLIYSGILNGRDKEALALSPNKELCAEACLLPLKLGRVAAVAEAESLAGLRPDQPEEIARVIGGLGNIDLRAVSAYRPLCFVSDSKFMLDFYASHIARCFRDAHVERIEIADLIDYDFEPTKNHIFVRSCDEDAFNLFLLSFCGDVPVRAFDMAKNFLQSGKRKKFRLNHPGLVLDLSSVLPVCFCDRENAKHLSPYCELIRIAEPTAREKGALIEGIVREKAEMYGVKRIEMQEGLAEALSAYGMDEIDGALDAAVRGHRTEKLLLTVAAVLSYLKENGAKRNTFGFGGELS